MIGRGKPQAPKLGVDVEVVFDHDLGMCVATSHAHEIEVLGDSQHDAFWGLMQKITEAARARRGILTVPLREGRWQTGAEQREHRKHFERR